MQSWPRSVAEFAQTLLYDAGRVAAACAIEDGKRRPVEWMEDVFFLGMLDEFERNGVSQRVMSDMLGVSRRTLIRRIAAARENTTTTGVSVWNRIHDRLASESMTRDDLIAKFPSLDPALLAGIIFDMGESGWVVEEDGVLRAVEAAAWTDDDVETLLAIEYRLRREYDVEAVAAETGRDIEFVTKVASRMRDEEPELVDTDIDRPARWRVLTAQAAQVLDYLHHHVHEHGAKSHRGGLWAVSESAGEELLGAIEEQVESWVEASAELVRRDQTDPEDSQVLRTWSIFRTVTSLAPFGKR